MSDTEQESVETAFNGFAKTILHDGESVEAAIQRLVATLGDEEQSLFRKLCEIGLRCHLQPEHFRVLLVKARIRPERASELKAVLEKEKICERFVWSNLAWHAALHLARVGDDDPLLLQANAFMDALLQVGDWWEDQAQERGWVLVRRPDGDVELANVNVGRLEVLVPAS